MNLTDAPARDDIRSDLFRYTGRTDTRALLRCYRQNRGFRFQVWFRLVDVPNPLLRRLARWRRNRLAERYALHLHPKTQIGNNCNLSQFTTIGATGDSRAAIISDYVYIGPSVGLVNDITSGNDVMIGAGAVVIQDVPDNATVVGTPGRVIQRDAPPERRKTLWPLVPMPAAPAQP
ncbi:hypothetical protein [Pseudooceanicola sp. 200-1SW]|uniref:hypothetical protein n=1 Tax=Pseudooceanicola sp. 200-1SW TaxID=3425949 RepID=UPI003D7F4CC8